MTFNPDNPNEHEEYREMILRSHNKKIIIETKSLNSSNS